MAIIKHGDAKRGVKSPPEYEAWRSMKQRCLYAGLPHRQRYGGRGIGIDDPRWLDYENFLMDMGRRPSSNHSLERIDNDLGYSKNNCRWATRSEQQQNKANNKLNKLLVDRIRSLFAQGYKQSTLGRMFGLHGRLISKVVRNKIWR